MASGDTTSTSTRPWVERYRPKTLDEVSHQNAVVATLQNAVQTGRLPHLLFYGPPGSGKTSVALALCRQLWAPSQWRRRVLELNASDERGISVVRDKIKHFASLTVGNNNNNNTAALAGAAGNHAKRHKKPKLVTGSVRSNHHSDPQMTPNLFFSVASKQGNRKEEQDTENEEEDDENVKDEDSYYYYPNPPYKIIILDEADTVTPDAQAALRRIIEAYSKITRFILICNYVTRIIEPLASRCAKFRFQALPPAAMKQRLLEIAHDQGCQDHVVTMQIMDTILQVAQGDMRRAVTTLQSVHNLSSSSSVTAATTTQSAVLTKDDICELAGLPSESAAHNLLASFQKGSFDAMKQAVDHVLAEGYSAQLLLLALLPLLTHSTLLTELDKAELMVKLATAEHAMVQGADESLQLLAVGSTAVQCFARSKTIVQNQQ